MTESVSSHSPAPFAVPSAVAAGLVDGELSLSQVILARARERAPTTKPGYAGNVIPQEAWELISSHAAVLVDVRTAEERQFVGRVQDSIHVPWLIGPSLQRNPRFVREVESKVRRDDVLLLLCRSGSRSVAAAQALTEARFRNAFNILEGFEGELDEAHQRGALGGWRFHRLPLDSGLTDARGTLQAAVTEGGITKRPGLPGRFFFWGASARGGCLLFEPWPPVHGAPARRPYT